MIEEVLAALVVRQAKQIGGPHHFVCGIDRIRNSTIGLSAEDRRAMAMVSALCIESGAGGDPSSGRADVGAEIHELLYRCSLPLGEWIPARYLERLGLERVCLIDSDEGTPTQEATDLARRFSSSDALFEELLFEHFKEELMKQGQSRSAKLYTAIREFVVRHPLATDEEMQNLHEEHTLPLSVLAMLRDEFYQPLPPGWIGHAGVPTCSQCGNAMRMAEHGWYLCRTKPCHSSGSAATTPTFRQADGLRRAAPAIAQFWINPGFDELRMFDALRARGVAVDLYPGMDTVDLAVGRTGVDMKSYMSPELLGRKLADSRGGLALYETRLLVIPDWLAQAIPNYLQRLRTAMGDAANQVEAMIASTALSRLSDA